MNSWGARFLLVLCVCGWPGVARAQSTQQAEARVHFDRGLKLVDEKRFEEAAAQFETAQLLQPHPFVLYNLGMAQAAARRPAAALKTFDEYLASAAGRQNEARAREVRARVAELESKVGFITIELEPAEGELRVDGHRHEAPGVITLDPGRHALVATASGYTEREQELLVTQGERTSLSLRLSPAEAASSDSYPLLPLPRRGDRSGLLRVSPGPNATTPPARRPPMSRELRPTTTWFVATLAGTGVLLGAASAAVFVDSSNRYSKWQREDAAIALETANLPQGPEFAERRQVNRERAERIKFEDGLATGLGVASGLFLVSSAVWWLLEHKPSPRSLALRSDNGQALLLGHFD